MNIVLEERITYTLDDFDADKFVSTWQEDYDDWRSRNPDDPIQEFIRESMYIMGARDFADDAPVEYYDTDSELDVDIR